MPTPVVINTEADEMSQNENKHPVDDQLFSTNPREGSTSRSPSKDAIGFSPPKSSSRKVEGNNTTMITSRSPSGSQSKFEDENFNQSLKPLSAPTPRKASPKKQSKGASLLAQNLGSPNGKAGPTTNQKYHQSFSHGSGYQGYGHYLGMASPQYHAYSNMYQQYPAGDLPMGSPYSYSGAHYSIQNQGGSATPLDRRAWGSPPRMKKGVKFEDEKKVGLEENGNTNKDSFLIPSPPPKKRKFVIHSVDSWEEEPKEGNLCAASPGIFRSPKASRSPMKKRSDIHRSPMIGRSPIMGDAFLDSHDFRIDDDNEKDLDDEIFGDNESFVFNQNENFEASPRDDYPSASPNRTFGDHEVDLPGSSPQFNLSPNLSPFNCSPEMGQNAAVPDFNTNNDPFEHFPFNKVGSSMNADVDVGFSPLPFKKSKSPSKTAHPFPVLSKSSQPSKKIEETEKITSMHPPKNHTPSKKSTQLPTFQPNHSQAMSGNYVPYAHPAAGSSSSMSQKNSSMMSPPPRAPISLPASNLMRSPPGTTSKSPKTQFSMQFGQPGSASRNQASPLGTTNPSVNTVMSTPAKNSISAASTPSTAIRYYPMSASRAMQSTPSAKAVATPMTAPSSTPRNTPLHTPSVEEIQKSQLQQHAPCNCKKSKCLKLYCECFAAQVVCNGCKCQDCHNTSNHEAIRQEAFKATKSKNSTAFKSKFSKDTKAHVTGCKCKKSKCLKKYCECFESGITCGAKCKCENCKNFAGSDELIQRRKRMGKSGDASALVRIRAKSSAEKKSPDMTRNPSAAGTPMYPSTQASAHAQSMMSPEQLYSVYAAQQHVYSMAGWGMFSPCVQPMQGTPASYAYTYPHYPTPTNQSVRSVRTPVLKTPPKTPTGRKDPLAITDKKDKDGKSDEKKAFFGEKNGEMPKRAGLHIMTFLDDLYNVSLVSKNLSSLATDEALWTFDD